MGAIRDKAISGICHLLRLAFRPSPSPVWADNPRSLLIIKPCCLGDVLMATAAIAALRATFPNAHLAFAVGTWARPALSGNPRLDELIDADGLGGRLPFRWGRYLRFVQKVRQRRFDACLVLDRSPLLTLIPFLAAIPIRAGLDSQERGFSLTHRVTPNPERHEAELYLDVVSAFGVAVAEPRLEFFPSPAEAAWAEAILAPLKDAGARNIVAIHPGGGENPGMSLPAKRWCPEGFATIARRLLEAGAGVVLTGAASEEGLMRTVRSALGEIPEEWSARLREIAGQATLGQLGALLAGCDLFLGNDSGPLHLAVAVGTPVVGIYGPTSPANYGPFDKSSLVVYKSVPCSPCFGRGGPGPGGCDQHCLGEVMAEEVWSQVQPFLASKLEVT